MKKETVLPSRKKWYLFAGTAGILIIISLVALGVVIWNRYKKAIFQVQEKQMLVTVQSMSNLMKNTLDAYAADITGLSRTAFDENGKINTEVLEEYSANSVFLNNLILTDGQNRVLWEKKDEQFPDEYCSSVMADGEVSFRVCRDTSGGLQFLFSRKLEQGGSICSVMSVDRYYGMFSKIQVGSAGYIILKSSDGILLMHPDPAQIGINVISGRQQQHPDLDLSSLEKMVEKQKRGETGTADYYSYWWTDKAVPRVRKIAAYAPVSVGTDFLILSIDMDYNDILKPLSNGFSGIVVIMTAILAVICAFLVFVYILALKDRKNREEIQYLRNLNEVLEKTHQGEEALAHQQRLQIMGTMTGGIVHEFNNLLTPIMGYADMLMSSLPEKSDDYDSAREIFEASEKAEDIIRQISSLSRKNIETAFHYIDAEQLIRRSVKMIRTICPYHIRIEETIAADGAGFLGNKTQMNQVLLNLCVNAFHAIGDAQDGKVLIQTEKVGKDCLLEDGIRNVSAVFDTYIRIRVSDNGCGMDPVTLEQIFQPFFTTRPAGQGTGLGLAVVDQIIHSHKGEISVKSRKGAGSVFSLYLPVSEKNAEIGATDDKKAGISPKFMLIEPNPKILQILGHDFSKIGIRTVTAEHLDQAEERLKEEKPDVLILETAFTASGSDCMGIDFAMSIMEKYTGMIRIVMADKIRKEIVEAKQKGIIDDYIEKPVSVSSILDAVRRIHTTAHGTAQGAEKATEKAGR